MLFLSLYLNRIMPDPAVWLLLDYPGYSQNLQVSTISLHYPPYVCCFELKYIFDYQVKQLH